MSILANKPIALIPARGGSKRFPRKNVAHLAGKPLLQWTLEAATESGIFDQIWVSSEDAEIQSLASDFGAMVHRRDDQLAQDRSGVAEVCRAFVDFLQTSQQREIEWLYVLLPTSPLRRPQTLRRAWQLLQASKADSLLSVHPAPHQPEWSLIEKKGFLRPSMPDLYETKRQDLASHLYHDGGHAIIRVSALRARPEFLGPQTLAFPVDTEEAVDVNEPIDLAWAEFVVSKSA